MQIRGFWHDGAIKNFPYAIQFFAPQKFVNWRHWRVTMYLLCERKTIEFTLCDLHHEDLMCSICSWLKRTHHIRCLQCIWQGSTSQWNEPYHRNRTTQRICNWICDRSGGPSSCEHNKQQLFKKESGLRSRKWGEGEIVETRIPIVTRIWDNPWIAIIGLAYIFNWGSWQWSELPEII